MQRTLSIIKPDATKRNITGSINNIIEDSGLRIIAQKRFLLSISQAKEFYSIHSENAFFNDLIKYMTSEPVTVQVLEGPEAVLTYRNIMGATDPNQADEGTIRKLHALNVQENSVHGSDSNVNAEKEINFFFREDEIVG